jgi:hypothetical protein
MLQTSTPSVKFATMRRRTVGALPTFQAFWPQQSESTALAVSIKLIPFSGRRGWQVGVFDVTPLGSNGKVTISTLKTNSAFFLNAVLQAKRLKKELKIPLNVARDVLARGPYRCRNWSDLAGRLRSTNVEAHALQLASLPDGEAARRYLQVNIKSIAHSISQNVLVNCDLVGLYQLVRLVFLGSREEISVEHVVRTLATTAWQSANIGPDPDAVLLSTASIGGSPFRLIATRIYLPAYFDFGDEVKCDPVCAEPFGEKIRIMWSDPLDWYEAARAYLVADEDDLDTELVLPTVDLDVEMAQHEHWLHRAMSRMSGKAEYIDEYDDLTVPMISTTGTYALFGFASETTERAPLDLPLEMNEHWGSEIVVVDSHPVYVGWSGIGDKIYREDAARVRETILTHGDYRDSSKHRNADDRVVYLRPATNFDLRHAMKVEVTARMDEETLTLKSDDSKLAALVLAKVAAREVTVDKECIYGDRYILSLELASSEACGLSLSLQTQEGLDAGSYRNLIETSVWVDDEEKCQLHLSLDATLLSLVQSVGKRTLVHAVTHGLVLRRHRGFAAGLKILPGWAEQLPKTEKAVLDVFERNSPPALNLSIFDLFNATTKTKYERDNF